MLCRECKWMRSVLGELYQCANEKKQYVLGIHGLVL